MRHDRKAEYFLAAIKLVSVRLLIRFSEFCCLACRPAPPSFGLLVRDER